MPLQEVVEHQLAQYYSASKPATMTNDVRGVRATLETDGYEFLREPLTPETGLSGLEGEDYLRLCCDVATNTSFLYSLLTCDKCPTDILKSNSGTWAINLSKIARNAHLGELQTLQNYAAALFSHVGCTSPRLRTIFSHLSDFANHLRDTHLTPRLADGEASTDSAWLVRHSSGDILMPEASLTTATSSLFLWCGINAHYDGGARMSGAPRMLLGKHEPIPSPFLAAVPNTFWMEHPLSRKSESHERYKFGSKRWEDLPNRLPPEAQELRVLIATGSTPFVNTSQESLYSGRQRFSFFIESYSDDADDRFKESQLN